MANAYNAVKLHAAKDGQLAGGRNAKIEAINELAFALSSGAERAQESRELGVNFTRMTEQVYQLDIGLSAACLSGCSWACSVAPQMRIAA